MQFAGSLDDSHNRIETLVILNWCYQARYHFCAFVRHNWLNRAACVVFFVELYARIARFHSGIPAMWKLSRAGDD